MENLGFPELHFTLSAKNSVLLRLEGVCIEMPVECEYIYLGKNGSKIISNLVMFPTIENFYLENETSIKCFFFLRHGKDRILVCFADQYFSKPILRYRNLQSKN